MWWWKLWCSCCLGLFILFIVGRPSNKLLARADSLAVGNSSSVDFRDQPQLKELKSPCHCLNGECGCCTGNILQNFNIHMRNHLCINVTYEPEDLSIGVSMSLNDLVLLNRRVSGRNPPPFCISLPRISIIKFCGRLTNVYLVGRNIHACISLETEWNQQTVFSFSLDCIRLGMDGVAVLPPEAGGGLPHPIDQEADTIEEYDELLENQSTQKPSNNSTAVSTPVSTTRKTITTVVVKPTKKQKSCD